MSLDVIYAGVRQSANALQRREAFLKYNYNYLVVSKNNL